MIHAVRFYEEVRAGSSLPLLVGGDDGKKYVVKLNGAGNGVLSNVVEWVSSKLGGLVQIPVLQPVLIAIDAGLTDEAGDPETKELLERSAGINLGEVDSGKAARHGSVCQTGFVESAESRNGRRSSIKNPRE